MSFVAPLLQLVLNLFDVRCIACSECTSSARIANSMSMSVSVGTFIGSPSIAHPLELIEIRCSYSQSACQRVSACKWMKNTHLTIGSGAPRRHCIDLPRALTEFGHTAAACRGRCLHSKRNDPNQFTLEFISMLRKVLAETVWW